jgi:hypothetical protein
MRAKCQRCAYRIAATLGRVPSVGFIPRALHRAIVQTRGLPKRNIALLLARHVAAK